jgi:hypothetical protein
MRRYSKLIGKKVTLITTASYFFSLIATLQQFSFPKNDGKLFLTLITTQHSENIMKGFIKVKNRFPPLLGKENCWSVTIREK